MPMRQAEVMGMSAMDQLGRFILCIPTKAKVLSIIPMVGLNPLAIKPKMRARKIDSSPTIVKAMRVYPTKGNVQRRML